MKRIPTVITCFRAPGVGLSWSLRAVVPGRAAFCNKTLFRNKFRERECGAVLQEVDTLIARGVDYIYWIDEIFGVGKTVRATFAGTGEASHHDWFADAN